MSNPAPTSREHAVYLAIWRKALKSQEPIVIKCSSKNMAISIRQGMYRAIRPFRDGVKIDEELRRAADKQVVSLEHDKDKIVYWLEVRPRKTLDELEGLLDELGIEEDDLLLGDERAAKLSLEKLIAPKKTSTPFYSSED